MLSKSTFSLVDLIKMYGRILGIVGSQGFVVHRQLFFSVNVTEWTLRRSDVGVCPSFIIVSVNVRQWTV